MSQFAMIEDVAVDFDPKARSACYAYAVAELVRLLGRMGVKARKRKQASPQGRFVLKMGPVAASRAAGMPSLAGLKHDGFVLAIRSDGVAIHALTAKGVLNGVYELAERMGFLFLLPTEEWEWPPEDGWRGVRLSMGDVRMDPRFAHRGVYGVSDHDFTVEEWARFYAKIRFNAIGCSGVDPRIAEQVGLRLEAGGHGLSGLLPRDLFESRPELFRMFQPEDFNGQRRNDSNLCAANPDAKRVIQASFRKWLRAQKGVYAAHAWADDLPGGGWCMCSLCRGLTASDQYLLAMRHLAEVIREEQPGVRIPVIAYHDTVLPPPTIEAPPESFLLFAPRERCYGHALGDASCARNRIYMQALKEWLPKFSGGDAHTFEYYFDQVLFRGLYPFLPAVILDDMKVYQEQGLASHMSIHCLGPEIAPEFNMLLFARAHWDAALTPPKFIDWIARRVSPAKPAAWRTYLAARQTFFEDAMRFCDHPFELYMDYRFLPENVTPFGLDMVRSYRRASAGLAGAAAALSRSAGGAHERVRRLVKKECGRARFEAAEFDVMALQQDGVNNTGRYLSRGDRKALAAGIRSLRGAVAALDIARAKALAAGVSPEAGYPKGINPMLKDEFQRKATRYAKAALRTRRKP